MQRDYHRRLLLDFSIIADAQAYYSELAYIPTAIPWVISEEAYLSTLPAEVKPFGTLGGFLPGSAEQSFIHMLFQGEKLGRVQATSPCFRDEDHDELHSPYFFKLELFDNTCEPTGKNVLLMLDEARGFFERHLPTSVVQEDETSWDIQGKEAGVELGSYGIRRVREHTWIYGTGVALPRLEQVLSSSSRNPDQKVI